MANECIRLYTGESARHQGKPLHEWLLALARECGIRGGSVFRAVAGYGRHGRVHEEHFFELAGDLPLVVEFYAETHRLDLLVSRIKAAQVSLFFVRFQACGGLTTD